MFYNEITMNKREQTVPVKIGNIQIGGNNSIVIQSMCDIKTSKIDEVSKQINECASLGAQMMRVSVLDKDDALAIKEIKKEYQFHLLLIFISIINLVFLL